MMPGTPVGLTVEPESIAELDAFELRWHLVYGLSLSDGLRVDVIDEDNLMVAGFDSKPTRGIYLATGRLLYMKRDTGWLVGRHARPGPDHDPVSFADLEDDLAWVRRRSDP